MSPPDAAERGHRPPCATGRRAVPNRPPPTEIELRRRSSGCPRSDDAHVRRLAAPADAPGRSSAAYVVLAVALRVAGVAPRDADALQRRDRVHAARRARSPRRARRLRARQASDADSVRSSPTWRRLRGGSTTSAPPIVLVKLLGVALHDGDDLPRLRARAHSSSRGRTRCSPRSARPSRRRSRTRRSSSTSRWHTSAATLGSLADSAGRDRSVGADASLSRWRRAGSRCPRADAADGDVC